MSDEQEDRPQHTGKALKREPLEHALSDMGYEPRVFLKVIAFNKDEARLPDKLYREPATEVVQFFGPCTPADATAACVALVNSTRDLVEGVARAVADSNPNIKRGRFLKAVYSEAQGLNLQHPDRRMGSYIDPVKPRRREKESTDEEDTHPPEAASV